MGDSNSIVSLGEITKPATVLIKRISDAVGTIFEPVQIVRVARAEAKAAKIAAEGQIEIDQLQRRALQRFAMEEARNQANIEEITRKALPHVSESAKPEEIEEDWIANFFDKCRLISNAEMQRLWALLLAGEANAPGAFSKRTVDALSSFDRQDAEIFRALCTFCCGLGSPTTMVFDFNHQLYKKHKINFNALTHLDAIGLIRFDANANYIRLGLPREISLTYRSHVLRLKLPEGVSQVAFGAALLTQVGHELAPLCETNEEEPEFLDYLRERFRNLRMLSEEEAVEPSKQEPRQ